MVIQLRNHSEDATKVFEVNYRPWQGPGWGRREGEPACSSTDQVVHGFNYNDAEIVRFSNSSGSKQ